jgi:hypothetical protein
LSMLVIGCPTKQINISIGLKQGDPLALFWFFIIVEGLSLLMAKLVSLGYFGGFLVLNSHALVWFLICKMVTIFYS